MRRAANDGGLRPMFRQHLRSVGLWTTIETGLVTQGVPDSYLLLRARDPRDSLARSAWIEHKWTDGWKIGSLKPSQVGWIYSHWLYGGAALIAVRRSSQGGPRSGPPCDDLYLISGEFARELKRDGLKDVALLLHERGGPSAWSWFAVQMVLESTEWLCRGTSSRALPLDA